MLDGGPMSFLEMGGHQVRDNQLAHQYNGLMGRELQPPRQDVNAPDPRPSEEQSPDLVLDNDVEMLVRSEALSRLLAVPNAC
jgi:hypothetical protein